MCDYIMFSYIKLKMKNKKMEKVLTKCIEIVILLNTNKNRKKIKNVYFCNLVMVDSRIVSLHFYCMNALLICIKP